MEQQSNAARQIRAIVETLGEIAERYPHSTRENEQIEEVRELVGTLISLPDPPDADD